jgi:hypothetical protein
MIAQLKAEHFDAAIIFTSFRQSPLPAAYLCYLADIPLRLVSPPMVVAAAAELLASAQKDIELVEEVAR